VKDLGGSYQALFLAGARAAQQTPHPAKNSPWDRHHVIITGQSFVVPGCSRDFLAALALHTLHHLARPSLRDAFL